MFGSSKYSLPEMIINMTNGSECEQWSAYHRQMYNKFYMINISSQILCGINIITNLAAYVIFYQDRVASTFNRLLMNLSLCECFFQVCYILYSSVENSLLLQSRLVFSSYYRAVFFAKFYLFILVPGVTASHISRNWAVILISVYRFESLVRAFSTKWLIFREGRVLKVCLIVLGFSVLISVPRSIERNVFLCVSYNNSLVTITGFGHRAISLEIYKYVYVVATLFLFQNGGPAIIVCTIGSLIILKLADRKKIKDRLKGKESKKCTMVEETTCIQTLENVDNRDKSAGNMKNKSSIHLFQKDIQEKHRKPSRKNQSSSRGGQLVITLSILFVVCELPSFFNKLFGIFGILQDSFFSEHLVISSNFATLLDSFVNFFIYLLSNQRFREHLLQKLNALMLKLQCSCNSQTSFD